MWSVVALLARGIRTSHGHLLPMVNGHLHTSISPPLHPGGYSSLCQQQSPWGTPSPLAPQYLLGWRGFFGQQGAVERGAAGDAEPPDKRVEAGRSSPPCQAQPKGRRRGAGHRHTLCLRRERLCREGAARWRPGRRKSSDKIKGLLSHDEEPGGVRGKRRGHPGFKHSASAPDPGTFREHFLNLSPVFLTHKQFPHP